MTAVYIAPVALNVIIHDQGTDVEKVIKLEPGDMVRVGVYFGLAMATVLDKDQSTRAVCSCNEYVNPANYLVDKGERKIMAILQSR